MTPLCCLSVEWNVLGTVSNTLLVVLVCALAGIAIPFIVTELWPRHEHERSTFGRLTVHGKGRVVLGWLQRMWVHGGETPLFPPRAGEHDSGVSRELNLDGSGEGTDGHDGEDCSDLHHASGTAAPGRVDLGGGTAAAAAAEGVSGAHAGVATGDEGAGPAGEVISLETPEEALIRTQLSRLEMALARCPMHALGCYLVQGLLERANTLMRLSISVKESMYELTEDLPPLVLVGGASRVMRHQLGQLLGAHPQCTVVEYWEVYALCEKSAHTARANKHESAHALHNALKAAEDLHAARNAPYRHAVATPLNPPIFESCDEVLFECAGVVPHLLSLFDLGEYTDLMSLCNEVQMDTAALYIFRLLSLIMKARAVRGHQKSYSFLVLELPTNELAMRSILKACPSAPLVIAHGQAERCLELCCVERAVEASLLGSRVDLLEGGAVAQRDVMGWFAAMAEAMSSDAMRPCALVSYDAMRHSALSVLGQLARVLWLRDAVGVDGGEEGEEEDVQGLVVQLGMELAEREQALERERVELCGEGGSVLATFGVGGEEFVEGCSEYEAAAEARLNPRSHVWM